MDVKRPIVVIDDDIDDHEIVEMIFTDLKVEHERAYFIDSGTAFTYLKQTEAKPFLIICDINLPKLNGLEFKKQIDNDEELRSKSIPFIFLTTATEPRSINMAYRELTVQGFFRKADSVAELKRTLLLVIDYWTVSEKPK